MLFWLIYAICSKNLLIWEKYQYIWHHLQNIFFLKHLRFQAVKQKALCSGINVEKV